MISKRCYYKSSQSDTKPNQRDPNPRIPPCEELGEGCQDRKETQLKDGRGLGGRPRSAEARSPSGTAHEGCAHHTASDRACLGNSQFSQPPSQAPTPAPTTSPHCPRDSRVSPTPHFTPRVSKFGNSTVPSRSRPIPVAFLGANMGTGHLPQRRSEWAPAALSQGPRRPRLRGISGNSPS